MNEIEELLFEEITPIGFKVSVTKSYWEYITTVKHPHIKGMESDVIITLKNPEFIRQSRIDRNVYLFYREIEYNDKNYHMCVVTNKSEGFIITAYITDRIKEGVQIWKKSK
ncbi:MAG: DUF4258 domain-containing protein [Euryarchaeota archaeon]|nr:DUF4258 domain-containing protein [Euryarchaeota archaeon]MCG2736394.1 hypothetical protein [Candidatus Methanoperedenaceae archaeon]